MNRKKNSAFLRLRSFQSNIMTPRRNWLSPTSMHLVLLLCCLRFVALWAGASAAAVNPPNQKCVNKPIFWEAFNNSLKREVKTHVRFR